MQRKIGILTSIIIIIFITLSTGCKSITSKTSPTPQVKTGITESNSTLVKDIDHDGIDDSLENQLIDRFAPVVKLHPEEQYLPANVEWFLSRVRMRFDVSLGLDKQILDKGEVMLNNLINQRYDNQSSGLSADDTDFFLEATDINGGDSIDEYKKETKAGLQSPGWRCYARVHNSPGITGSYDIQYIFYYAYNGDLLTGPLNTEHESDFEHITVRILEAGYSISQIYYSAHDNEGKWYKIQTTTGAYDGYSLTSDGRPVVYSALNSHASYPWAGKWQRNNLPDDHTAGDGYIWDCRTSVQNVGEKLYPLKDMQWIQFSGHWGEIGTQSFTTGPLGPAYQSWWEFEP